MPILRLSKHDADDPALLFRLEHILDGVVRFGRPRCIHIVEIDQWFGPRWCGFAGTRDGVDVVELECLHRPPFTPGRVRNERTLWRRGDVAKEQRRAQRLHESTSDGSNRSWRLDERGDTGVFVWYSGDTVAQDRAALMVYAIHGTDQRAWYAGFRRDEGTWQTAETRGIDVAEIHALETACAGTLAALPRDDLWTTSRELAAQYRHAREVQRREPALARVISEGILREYPDHAPTRILLAGILTDFAQHERARSLLEGIPPLPLSNARLDLVLTWGRLHAACGEMRAEEECLREATSLHPGWTGTWIMLGACLARQGRFEEALAIHRHAATLEGDPDEALLNIGLVLRGLGRLDEAADVLRESLELDPDVASTARALADVEAAIAWRSAHATE